MLTLTDKALHSYSLGRQRNRDVPRDGPHRPPGRRRHAGARAVGVHRHQLVVPAAPRHADAAGDDRVSLAQPGRRDDALHAVRGDGADHAGGSGRPAERRGAGRHGLHPDRAPRSAGRLRRASRRNVDMQSGAPAFGTPEYVRTAMLGGQLARRYGVPYRSSNVCAANALDAQAAYESVFSLWGAVMGGVNFLMHGAGWMEGGLHASLEQDGARRRPAGRWSRRCSTRSWSTTTRWPSTPSREVGPGGHFFGVGHTQERFRTRVLPADDLATGATTRPGTRPGGRRRPAGPRAGSPVPRRLRAAADGRGGARGARGLRRPTRRRGWRPDRLLTTTEQAADASREDGAMKASAQVVVIGGGVVGRLRALPPHQGGLDRRRAGRAQGAHGRLDVARGRRDAHAERRPQRVQAAAVHHRAVQGDRGRAPARTAPSTCPAASCWPTPASASTGCAWPRPAAATSAWTWRSSPPAEAKAIFPLLEEQYFVGALYDPVEGHVDPDRRHQRLRHLRPPGRAPRSTATPG